MIAHPADPPVSSSGFSPRGARGGTACSSGAVLLAMSVTRRMLGTSANPPPAGAAVLHLTLRRSDRSGSYGVLRIRRYCSSSQALSERPRNRGQGLVTCRQYLSHDLRYTSRTAVNLHRSSPTSLRTISRLADRTKAVRCDVIWQTAGSMGQADTSDREHAHTPVYSLPAVLRLHAAVEANFYVAQCVGASGRGPVPTRSQAPHARRLGQPGQAHPVERG